MAPSASRQGCAITGLIGIASPRRDLTRIEKKPRQQEVWGLSIEGGGSIIHSKTRQHRQRSLAVQIIGHPPSPIVDRRHQQSGNCNKKGLIRRSSSIMSALALVDENDSSTIPVHHQPPSPFRFLRSPGSRILGFWNN
ncbi:uncharacterized protein LOC109133697 isoform X2 [Beta vulgaris subsp. vulgaris]|uniref:uncharacterized protein LOC109133697 isoform X2 n=1 Tax=Beta vulgaris subsp. vulgaris TaxID=3555 RepID=UPI00203740CE|nr:uncharacterized protein LOC109133697 isoform X2 [Beta vulgaris subsp. vulgaris]